MRCHQECHPTIIYHRERLHSAHATIRSYCTEYEVSSGVSSKRLSSRAGNSLIGFLSESPIFCEKMSEWAFCSEKTSYWLIRSFLVSNLSDSLMVPHFWWATWPKRSFLVTNMSYLLTSLIFGEPWAICSHCSFLVSPELTSVTKNEGMSESLIF